jgi:hypothetical protein
MEILQRGDVKLDRLVGSWAGAADLIHADRSSATQWTLIATAAAGSRLCARSYHLTANNPKNVGPGDRRNWATKSWCRVNFNFLLADHARTMTIRDWERQGLSRPRRFPCRRQCCRSWPVYRARVSMLAELASLEIQSGRGYALAINISPTVCAGPGLLHRTGRATSGAVAWRTAELRSVARRGYR